jgi:hypothetical protein
MSLCFAAPASALIGTGDNALLFLEVYDTVGGTSYVRDLGLPLASFGTQNRPTGGFTNIVDDQIGDAFLSAPDANFAAFVAGSSGAANLIGDVIAIDNEGTTAPDQRRVLFTSLTDVVTVIAQPGVQQSNSGLNAMAVIDAHIADTNLLLGFATSAITNNYNVNKSNNLSGGLSSSLGVTSAGLGQAMGFYYMTRSNITGPTGEALVAGYSVGATAFQWTLANDGTLTYNVAAIPEPTTLALSLAGELMLGSFARGRLKT